MEITTAELDEFSPYAEWALETGIWDGTVISRQDASQARSILEEKIIQYLFSQDPDSLNFQQMTATFAAIGSIPEEGLMLAADIRELGLSPEGILVPVGLFKSIAKFWKKHKVEILIGIAVIAAVTTVAVVAICASTAAVIGAAESTSDKAPTPQPHPRPIALPESSLPTTEPTPPPATSLLPLDSVVLLDGQYRSYQDLLHYNQWNHSLEELFDMPRFGSLDSLYFPTTSIDATNALPPLLPNNSNPPLNPPEPFSSSRGYSMPDPLEYSDFCDRIDVLLENVRIERRQEQETEWAMSHMDTYAASVLYNKTTNKIDVPPPFSTLPLIGKADQGTMHVHGGINNDRASAFHGGSILHSTLDKKLAVQPHLIHSNSLLDGLFKVHLEKLDNPQITLESLRPFRALNPDVDLVLLPRIILQHSKIQESIDYEVATLSKIAQNIIAKGNPKLKQVHVAFSNGGYVLNEALKKLPPEYRDTVIIITAGTTAIIDDHLAHKAYNLIGDKDWPSLHCNGGLKGVEEAKNKATVVIVPQTETDGVIGGHYFVQPDYQKEIKTLLIDSIENKYEVY